MQETRLQSRDMEEILLKIAYFIDIIDKWVWNPPCSPKSDFQPVSQITRSLCKIYTAMTRTT